MPTTNKSPTGEPQEERAQLSPNGPEPIPQEPTEPTAGERIATSTEPDLDKIRYQVSNAAALLRVLEAELLKEMQQLQGTSLEADYVSHRFDSSTHGILCAAADAVQMIAHELKTEIPETTDKYDLIRYLLEESTKEFPEESAEELEVRRRLWSALSPKTEYIFRESATGKVLGIFERYAEAMKAYLQQEEEDKVSGNYSKKKYEIYSTMAKRNLALNICKINFEE